MFVVFTLSMNGKIGQSFVSYCLLLGLFLIRNQGIAQEPQIRPVETYINLEADFGQYREQGEEKYYDSIAFPVLEKYHMLMSPAWYAFQARVWERELRRGKAGPEGWLYLYRALKLSGRTRQADSLRQHLQGKGPSWEADMIAWYAMPPERRSLAGFRQLFSKAPQAAQPLLIPELINVLEASCRATARDSLLNLWTQTSEWPRELRYYGYNLLQTPTEGAILFTDGPFETAAAILVQKEGIRADVGVVNLSLLPYPDYQQCLKTTWRIQIPPTLPEDIGRALNKIVEYNPKRTFYISQNTAKTTFKTLGLPLYCEGLAYRISKPSYSSFYRILDNVQGNYNLKYLEDSLSQNLFNRFRAPTFNMAYVPPLLQIFDLYYYRDERTQAEKWFEKALRIAKKAGHEDAVFYHRLFWERQGKDKEKPNQIKD